MKAKVKITKEVEVRYLKVDAGVRYWQDSEVNGESDIDLFETKGEGTPRMPFAVKVKDKPTDNICSDHYRWQPTIDVDRGCIVGWPEGTTAHVHYKVCDDGVYTLLDPLKNVIATVEDYVPDCLGEWGDYIVMDIGEDGSISGFSFGEEDVLELIANSY